VKGYESFQGLHLVPRVLFIATSFTYLCKEFKVKYVTCAPPPFPFPLSAKRGTMSFPLFWHDIWCRFGQVNQQIVLYEKSSSFSS
jgi:hypothetical protein